MKLLRQCVFNYCQPLISVVELLLRLQANCIGSNFITFLKKAVENKEPSVAYGSNFGEYEVVSFKEFFSETLLVFVGVVHICFDIFC